MVPSANLKTLLKHYSSKKNSPVIGFAEFCDYMHRYAQKYVEDQSELLPYVQNTSDAITRNIWQLVADKSVLIINEGTPKKAIIVAQFFIDKFTSVYNDIAKDTTLPFPMSTDLPKYITGEIFSKVKVSEYIDEITNQDEENKGQKLYGLNFQQEIPVMLIPSTVPLNIITSVTLAKLKAMLKREEHHDYFLKKLKVANPGKELSVKNFFDSFIARQSNDEEVLRNPGDNFYYWGQLCHFIKQDYEKLKDMTHEDICVLQSVGIIEVLVAYYRSKTQSAQKKSEAFKSLDKMLTTPPYYFSMNDICSFNDQRGIPLLGQYTNDDLNDWIKEKTTNMEGGNLPGLLIFTLKDGTTYFIKKVKVMALILKMTSDARDIIVDMMKQEWSNALKNFDWPPEIKDQAAFEKKVQKSVQEYQPVLHAILNASFLSIINFEMQNSKSPESMSITLFRNGVLLPYSEILMISRQEIMQSIKISLPFWYTIPFFSKLLAIFRKGAKAKNKKQKEFDTDDSEIETPKSAVSSKEEIKSSMAKIEKRLVPEGSTIEAELKSLNGHWNNRLGKTERDNLTEDVNSLIRDYIRKLLRTPKISSFTPERIEQLAQQLAATSSLSQLKDKESLTKYIQLYIVKIVKNIK